MTPESGTKPKVERGGRIANQPGYVLHSTWYTETSLIVDLFTRAHGRQGELIAGIGQGMGQTNPVA